MKTSSWLVLSLLLVLPLVARAQSPEELEAFSYFKEGRTAMEAGDCVRRWSGSTGPRRSSRPPRS
jgi:hypothetical protein